MYVSGPKALRALGVVQPAGEPDVVRGGRGAPPMAPPRRGPLRPACHSGAGERQREQANTYGIHIGCEVSPKHLCMYFMEVSVRGLSYEMCR